jgi:glycosyltransferase involved in cell wall biosynthesis
MPVFNAEATLRRAIDSVLQQSHSAFEVIAVDDGSLDASWALLQAYAAADPRVRPLRVAANGGVAAARNLALAAAAGQFVAFLDSDDWWHPQKLERQLATMRNTGALVSYTAFQRVGEDGRVLSNVVPPREVRYRDMLRSNHIGNLTGMYARDLGDMRFLRIGHEDYVFWLDCVRRAGRAVCVPSDEPLAWYLVRANSVSSNKIRAATWQWRIYRDIEKLGLAASIYYMAFYICHALSKRRRV